MAEDLTIIQGDKKTQYEIRAILPSDILTRYKSDEQLYFVLNKIYSDPRRAAAAIFSGKKDTYDNGKPLLAAVSGVTNDDETGAVGRIRQILGLQGTAKSWRNKLSISNLDPNHQTLFKEQLAKLQAAIISKDNNFLFYIPSVNNPKAIGGGYISMEPDF